MSNDIEIVRYNDTWSYFTSGYRLEGNHKNIKKHQPTISKQAKVENDLLSTAEANLAQAYWKDYKGEPNCVKAIFTSAQKLKI